MDYEWTAILWNHMKKHIYAEGMASISYPRQKQACYWKILAILTTLNRNVASSPQGRYKVDSIGWVQDT